MTFTPDPFAAPQEPTGSQPAGITTQHQGSTQAAPPADWYADPTQPGTLRYWDGTAWTSHTAPAPAQSTSGQPTFATFDTAAGVGTPPAPAPKRRRLVTVASIVGGIVVVLGIRLIGIGGFDAVTAFFNSTDPEPLSAQAGADWLNLEVLEGHGTVKYDPAWQDAGLDLAQLSKESSVGPGPDVSVDAAWIIDTDADGNQSILFVYSARGLTGVIQPELEVDAWIDSVYPEKTGTEKVSGTAIVTDSDVRGYMAEFEYDYYGWHFVDSAAAVVHGPDEVVLYVSSAGEETGSGVDELEAVLNSLRIGG